MSIFYQKSLNESRNSLSEEESKHCYQVLRHQNGDEIQVFDGNGGKHRAVLTHVSKHKCEFEVIESKYEPPKKFSIHLAIAPTKNADRMEWLLEKLSEVGVDEVTFIQTRHSERKKLRLDRLQKKVVSAMKQSGNPFLLKLNELISFEQFLKQDQSEQKYIAHVDDSHQYLGSAINSKLSTSIVIGPEGDFSADEITLAKKELYKPVSLGENTLRTETAGLVACCMINTINRY